MKQVFLFILLQLLPHFSFGGELTEISGFCGKEDKNIKWIVNTEDNTLVFEGSGEMQDFQYDNQPWKQYNDQINSITINEGIIYVGDCAFQKMKFSNIDLPSSIETIGNYAFAQCENLKTINLPDKISKVGQYAFYYSGLESIIIPASIQDLEVGLFQSCTELKSITIPEGIISIGNSTFKWCNSLSIISLPNTIESIGENAFEDCSNLTSINLIEGITNIGSYAFRGTGLTQVTVPSTITELKSYVFDNCKNLATINLHNDLVTIGDQCFGGCVSLKEVIIPENCIMVKASAFSLCEALERVVLKNNTSFGNYAFGGCTSLSTVELPENFEDYNMGDRMFSNCPSLQSLYNKSTFFYMSEESEEIYSIPAGISKIAKYAFSGNRIIKKLILPSSINSIGSYAFSGTNIEELDLSNLEYVYIGKGTFSSSAIKNIIASDKIRNCPLNSFESCQNLEELDLSGIESSSSSNAIGNYAFRNCYNLIKVIIPENDDQHSISIGEEAFCNCENLEEFDFSSVYRIENRAFVNCKSLTNVKCSDFRNSMLEVNIGYEAFLGCVNLERIEIGSNGTNLFYLSSFADCDNLKEIVYNSENIPNVFYLTYDYYNDIWEGKNTEHSLPYKKLTFKILGYLADKLLEQDYSFWSRVKIERIYENLLGECGDKGDNITWSLNTSEGVLRIIGSGNMKMPENETLLTWKDRKRAVKEIQLSDDIESICPSAFNYLPIKTLKLNKNLKEIGNYAFYGCEMETIEFNESLKKICFWAFGSCMSLKKAILNEGLEELEYSVFNMCDNLEKLVLPNSLSIIGEAITGSCRNLKTIFLPKRITKIPNYTFDACNNLKDVYIPSITPPSLQARNDYNGGLKMNSNITIHIPQGTTDAYNSAAVWSQHKTDEYYEYVNISSNDGGVFVVNQETINTGEWDDYLIKGENISIKVVPDDYYTVNSIFINGKESISDLKDNTLNYNALDKSMDIQIEFKANEYNLSVINHGPGLIHIWDYDIEDKAKFKISYPEKTDISFVPNTDCSLESLLINGIESKDRLVDNVYSFENTTENIIIEAFFSSQIRGDANGDGLLNDLDIDEIVRYIMGDPSEYFNFGNADMNKDGKVNAADIVTLITLIKNLQND